MYTNTNLYNYYSAAPAQELNNTVTASTNPSDETGEACGLVAYLYSLVLDAIGSYGSPNAKNELAEIQRVIGLLKKIYKDVAKFDPTIGNLVKTAISLLDKPLTLDVLTAFRSDLQPILAGSSGNNPILNWMANFIPSSSASPDVLFSYLMFTQYEMLEYPDEVSSIEKLFANGGSILNFANEAALFLCAYVNASPDKEALGSMLSNLFVEDLGGSVAYNQFVSLFKTNWETWTPPSGMTAQEAEKEYLEEMIKIFQNQ